MDLASCQIQDITPSAEKCHNRGFRGQVDSVWLGTNQKQTEGPAQQQVVCDNGFHAERGPSTDLAAVRGPAVGATGTLAAGVAGAGTPSGRSSCGRGGARATKAMSAASVPHSTAMAAAAAAP